MKTKRYLSRLVSMLLVCSMLVSMIPVMVLPASAAEQGKVLEDVTLTAESTASTNRTVSGTGNKVLTFTAAITDPDKTLKANIKMYRDPGEGEGTSKIEVLRFKLDRGNIKLSDLSKTGSSINYTTMAPYDDGKTYSLKLVLLPAGADTPATVKLYQVDGQTESQLGEDLEMPAGVTLEELTRLSFAVDSNSSVGASVTFSNMVYATGVDLGGSETPEEPGDETVIFSQDFEGEVAYQGDHTGSDVAEPTTTGETSNVLELTDLDTVSGTGNKALSFAVTPAAEGTLKAGVKFSSSVGGSTTEVLRFKIESGKFRVKEPASSGYTVLGDYTAGQAYNLKLYLIPASSRDAAQFKLYQVQGGRETLVETYTLTESTEGAKLEEITGLNFFTDSSNTGTATYTDISYATGVELPEEDPKPAATESWVPTQNADETFTLAEESVVATLPTSKITMAMGAGEYQVKAPTNGKPVTLDGVSYTKYLNALSGYSPKPEQKKGEYFKFVIPAEVSAGELKIAYRLNAGKVLRVLVDGESMEGFDRPEPPAVNTESVLKLSVEGGKTYLVYVESSMPYFYGFSFRPVDKEADMALFQAEIDKLDFNWIRGENTSATAVDKDLTLDTSYLSSFGMCDVTWTSSSVAVDGSGKVNRLAVDTPVTLTANISVQQISYLNLNKDFTVTVKALADDNEAVAGAKEALTLGSTTAVKKDLVLPGEGMHGTTVTWASSDPAVVTVDAASGLGVIHPNDSNAQTVTLTATITRGGVTDTKEFEVTVAAAKILDVNSWAYVTASGDAHFVPVDGGKLKSINMTNNNQHLDITEYLERKPKALSGGQRQRVAIGRAIVREPKVLLMDEPLSNLDAKLRNQMRAEITKLRSRINSTFVYVTHDQTEAMTLGDRIVIMKNGYIQQVGTPQEVFERPANLFVAGFIGMPQMNFFEDAQLADGKVTVQGATFTLGAGAAAQLAGKSGKVTMGVRPTHVKLARSQGPDTISATVDVSEMMGSEIHLHVTAQGKDVVLVIPTTDLPVEWRGGVPFGTQIHFTVPGEYLHLFDPETGDALLR